MNEHHDSIKILALKLFGLAGLNLGVTLTDVDILLKISLTILSIGYVSYKWYKDYTRKN